MAVMADIEPRRDEPGQPPFGDLLGDVPLLRELQRVLLSGSGPINWELARQIGIATAAWGGDDPAPSTTDESSFRDAVRVAELAVADLTGLSAPAEIPRVQAVRRAQWVEANTRSLREVLDPLGSKLASVMRDAGSTALPPEAAGGAGMLVGLMDQMGPLLVGAQVGGALGSLGQRVFGQFDLPVPRPTGNLLFVAHNVDAFEREWSLDARELRAWLALHEVTHRAQLTRSWCRPHFVALVSDVIEHADLDLEGLQRRLEGLDVANPEALGEAFEGAGNLFGDSSSPEQRLRIARVRAFVVAAEAHADHVVGVLANRMLSTRARIDEALRRHREGRHAERALEQLLGIEVTTEQHDVGRRFCKRVVELTDEATLSRMWDGAESLPSMPELEEPTLWLSRVA